MWGGEKDKNEKKTCVFFCCVGGGYLCFRVWGSRLSGLCITRGKCGVLEKKERKKNIVVNHVDVCEQEASKQKGRQSWEMN